MSSAELGSANRVQKWSFSLNRNAKPLKCSCMQGNVALRNCLIAMELTKKKRMQMQNRTNLFCTPKRVDFKRLGRSAKVHPLKGGKGFAPPLHPSIPSSRGLREGRHDG